jgi:hypothetical protein
VLLSRDVLRSRATKKHAEQRERMVVYAYFSVYFDSGEQSAERQSGLFCTFTLLLLDLNVQ